MNSTSHVMPVRKWSFKKEMRYHAMLLPSVILVFIFSYLPMAGLVMCFQNFNPMLSFERSKFVGFANFAYIFKLPNLINVTKNTIEIATLKILFGQTVPILLALLLNEVSNAKYKRTIQTINFLPYFLSWVILGGVFRELFALDGSVNMLLQKMTGQKIFFMADSGWFRAILIVTDVWKGMGYNMIIYLAASTNIDPALNEAASIDGCGRFRQVLHITLPGLLPMIILMATMSLGGILNAGFDQVWNMYNPLVYDSADIIDTYVYRVGMVNRQYSVSATMGLIKSLISLILVGISYYLAYKISDYRIF